MVIQVFHSKCLMFWQRQLFPFIAYYILIALAFEWALQFLCSHFSNIFWVRHSQFTFIGIVTTHYALVADSSHIKKEVGKEKSRGEDV